jgi:pimeloyl-ACP methyl ester carboxylesterase
MALTSQMNNRGSEVDSPQANKSLNTIWLEVEGLRIRCLTAGADGAPVLLIHGGGFDSANFSFKYTIEYLARNHRVFVPDLPGYGESDKPRINYTLDYYVEFLEHFMEAIGLERISLVGISLGGAAALGFALRVPPKVEKLVLVDCYGLGSKRPFAGFGYVLVHAPGINNLIWALLCRSRRMIRWSLYTVFHNRQVVTKDMVDEAYSACRRSGAGRAFRSFQRSEVLWGGLHTDFSERLHEVSVPTLIVHGEHDSAVPVSWARRAHQRIAGSRLNVLSRCGHASPRECPEEFNRIIGQFLKQ